MVYVFIYMTFWREMDGTQRDLNVNFSQGATSLDVWRSFR